MKSGDIVISKSCSDGCRVSLTGDLDVYTTPIVRESLKECLSSCERFSRVDLRLDITGVGFMDSAGLSLIIGLWRKFQGSEAQLVICGANTSVKRILKVTGLDTIIAQE